MSKIAVVYGSDEGQTEHIAGQIAATLRGLDFEAEVYNARRPTAAAALEGCAGAIVGASVHAGRHQRYVYDFVKTHRDTLAALPAAFFSVSLSAAATAAQDRATAQAGVERFCNQTGWHPKRTAAFAGALKYRRYGWLKRLIMRRIASRASGDTDTTRDYEYTDWDAVNWFVS